VALYFGTRIVGVQVKSTSARKRTGYLCHLRSAPQRPYMLPMSISWPATSSRRMSGISSQLSSLSARSARA
jgi:hypothetical protein